MGLANVKSASHHFMISVPLRSRRAQRSQFVQKLQHAIPSIVVLGDGIEHLSHEPHGLDLWLGIAEVAVSLLVIGFVIRGFRQLRAQTAAHAESHDAHHGVDWIDICLGAMLSVEAYAKYHATAHIPRPTIVIAVAMFTIGLLHGRIAAWGDRKRRIHVDAAGISVPVRPFSRLTLTWAEVASIAMDDRAVVITATDGRTRRIDLTDVLNPKPVRDAINAARTQLEQSRLAASVADPVTDPASS
ncbi:MAG TPA: hypothetical protein VM096_11330 [Vicinamibacterales bacterium]|nr:hypothetical protein [Vicinamibacterales bacterium]